MTRRIVIASKERDLLCHRILIHLSGIDRVWITADSKNLEEAVRLGRQVCDELQLVLDDLGRDDASEGAPVELSCGPEVVRRVVEFVRDSAVAEGTYERKWRVGNARRRRGEPSGGLASGMPIQPVVSRHGRQVFSVR
jgi:hypothetical protein